ncbi:MAG: XrtA system polysaccharide chain length determinant [bacterium]
MMDIKKQKKLSIFGYVYKIYRGKYLFFAIFTSVTLILISYSYLAGKKYEASSLILFEEEKVANPLERIRPKQQGAEKMTEKLKTIRQILLSRSKLLEVIKKLDLDLKVKDPLEMEKLIEDTKKAVEITMASESLFLISYEGDDPHKVRDFTNMLCQLFVEENMERLRGTANDAFSFIEGQLAVYKKKLEESENSLRLFKENNIGQMPGEENANLGRLENYRNLLTQAEIDLKEATLQKSILEEQLLKEKPLIVAFSSRNADSSLEAQLAKLEVQLSFLLTSYTDKYPEVIRVKGQIEEIKKGILKEKEKTQGESEEDKGSEETMQTEAINPSYQKIKDDLSQTNTRISTLQLRLSDYEQKIAQYQQKVQSIPEGEQKLAQLKRDYEVNNQIYQTLLNKLEEARIAKELEMKEKSINFQIIDPAQLPLKPSKPDKPKFILLGLAAGLSAALAIFYLLYYLDNPIVDLEDAKNYFNYPVLVTIPPLISEEERKRERRSNWILAAVTGIFFAATLALLIVEVINRYMI